MHFVVTLLAFVAAGLLFAFCRIVRFKRLVENVPTSKVKGVCMGLSEVKGRAEADGEPVVSPMAGQPSVYYRWSVYEQWQRVVTETDSQGRTSTRTESGSVEVAHGEHCRPFFVRDDTGALRVVPEGAKIEAVRVFSKSCTLWDPLYYAFGPRAAIPDSTGQRSLVEVALAVGQELYVLGSARLREDIAAPEIAKGRKDEPFLVSHRPEEKIVGGKRIGSIVVLVLGLLFAAAAPLPARRNTATSFAGFLADRAPAMLTGAALYGTAFAVFYTWLIRNELVRVRNRLKNALSLIDVQLQRRADLIPNLVAVVKASAAHEQSLQTLLAETRATGRTRTTEVRRLAQDLDRDHALERKIVALAEGYPTLRADTNFRQLFDALRDAEDRIALATHFYNDCVKALRNRLQTFPDVVVAKLSFFDPGPALPEDPGFLAPK